MLTAMLRLCPDTLADKRDYALLAPDGLRVQIRRSETDPGRGGTEIAVPRGYRLRPVDAVQAWLAAAEISSGPVFRPMLKDGASHLGRLHRWPRRASSGVV